MLQALRSALGGYNLSWELGTNLVHPVLQYRKAVADSQVVVWGDQNFQTRTNIFSENIGPRTIFVSTKIPVTVLTLT